MQAGLILLCLAYVLSQFFRAFLAVLTNVLDTDIGAQPDDLAFASGLWFLSFAAMQIPVGWLLDQTGPRRTASVLLLLGGGGGAAVFALATSPFHIAVAMLLIGIGCSPVLMASYYIFAREYPPARFATLAALMLGIGSLGNLVASYPTALAVDLMGWRATLGGLAAISACVAAGIWISVKDPEKAETQEKGSLFDLLKQPALWTIIPLMFVSYAPSASLRGLWAGPYLRDVFGQDTAQIGQATLVIGVAMIIGTFAYGPLDRVLGTRKWVIFGGNVLSLAALGLLGLWIDSGIWTVVILMAAVGFFRSHLPRDHGAWPRVLSAASGGPGRDPAEPVWHRRRRDHAICDRAHSHRHRRYFTNSALCRHLRLFRGLDSVRHCRVPVQPGQCRVTQPSRPVRRCR